MDNECTISIVAAEETLLVTLRFPVDADREALRSIMFQIIGAFAAVEQMTEKDLEGLFWEQKRLTRTEHCVVLRRPFTDPQYPERFDVAFRRLNHDFNEIRIH